MFAKKLSYFTVDAPVYSFRFCDQNKYKNHKSFPGMVKNHLIPVHFDYMTDNSKKPSSRVQTRYKMKK